MWESKILNNRIHPAEEEELDCLHLCKELAQRPFRTQLCLLIRYRKAVAITNSMLILKIKLPRTITLNPNCNNLWFLSQFSRQIPCQKLQPQVKLSSLKFKIMLWLIGNNNRRQYKKLKRLPLLKLVCKALLIRCKRVEKQNKIVTLCTWVSWKRAETR